MKKLFFRLCLSVSLLLSLSVSLSGCAKDYVTGRSTLNYYSLNDDIALGESVIKEQMKALEEKDIPMDDAADPRELQRIRRIVKKLAAVSHIPNLPYEVHLADVDIVNAWCAPGGKIMVYTGLWLPRKGLVQKDNDDELAAVLAHEISHANARHVTKAISKTSTLQLIGDVASIVIAEAGAPEGSNLFQQIFYGGLDLYLPSYSRKNESEADAIGIMYMAKAGYNPQAAVNLWERAAKASKNDKTSIFASHPSDGTRAKALEKLLPKAMEIYAANRTTNPARKKQTHLQQETPEKKASAPSDFSPGAKAKFKKGDAVQVLWEGKWYSAHVLKTERNKLYIHYDGYDNSWDEWVGPNRYKK